MSRRLDVIASHIPEADIDRIAYGFMGSQALFTALDLGVFDASYPSRASELSMSLGINETRLQTLLTALVALGLLARTRDGVYSLTPPSARHLARSSRAYYGDYLKQQVARQFYPRMARLSHALRDGATETYSTWFENPQEAAYYTTAQHNGSKATARQLWKRVGLPAKEVVLLDIGGGSGVFSIELARQGATCFVMELENVAKEGRGIVEREGMAHRVQYIEGSVLDDATWREWERVRPPGRTVVALMSYLCGSVPAKALPQLFSHVHNVAHKVVVHDFMVDDSLDGPPIAALWALQHVTVNSAGKGLHPAFITNLLEDAGYTKVTQFGDLIPGLTKLIVASKG
eukprot:Sspe_Gene.16603::Locus_5860_Transcript_1_1_Confidence_1.000_Length_1290::g.16603::m.16603